MHISLISVKDLRVVYILLEENWWRFELYAQIMHIFLPTLCLKLLIDSLTYTQDNMPFIIFVSRWGINSKCTLSTKYSIINEWLNRIVLISVKMPPFYITLGFLRGKMLKFLCTLPFYVIQISSGIVLRGH